MRVGGAFVSLQAEWLMHPGVERGGGVDTVFQMVCKYEYTTA